MTARRLLAASPAAAAEAFTPADFAAAKAAGTPILIDLTAPSSLPE